MRGVPPVAVLVSKNTFSAGEIVAIAFKGRPNTRFFGEDTGGATTAVQLFPLSDGAVLGLAVANDEDRNGVSYQGGIHPDKYVKSSIPEETGDPAIKLALDWLLSNKQ